MTYIDWPPFRFLPDYVEVPVRGPKGTWVWAKIDYADVPLVDGLALHLNNGYAYSIRHRQGHSRVSCKRTENRSLHSLIAGRAPPGMHIDHENHDRLDCRRRNLRHLPDAVNCGRTRVAIRGYMGDAPPHGYRGVKPAKEAGFWRVTVGTVHYGQYRDITIAAKVYDRVARARYPGQGRELNFPDDPLPEDFVIPNFNTCTRRAVKSSEWTGVSWFAPQGRWRVIFRKVTKGYFDDEAEAAEHARRVWEEAAVPYPGRRKHAPAKGGDLP